MKLFLFTVSMIVAVTVNCHGLPEPPDPKPPQPEHQPLATNSALESKYLNATTLVITGTSAKGVPIATKLSSKRHNDPCSSFGGQCIHFNEDLKSWEQADTSCKAKGQRLAVIQDPVAFHAYMRSNHDGERFWLGGSDQKQEGTWTWIKGQSLAGFPWGPGQPDDYKGNEDCLEWGHGSNYNDDLCTRAQRYVCEPELSECTPACQNGGICTAASECVCPDGWSGDICDKKDPCSSFGGQCINFNADLKSWEQADTSCKAKGQRLAVIQDPVAFHAYMRSNHVGERYWLGGSDIDHEGTWTWIKGQSLAGFPWGPGQPDDYKGNEDCLEWGHGSNYNDDLCTRAQRYVCEPACGTVNRKLKIVGGVVTEMHEYPWQVLVVGQLFCGGSLINDRWVLTAAHCISEGSHVVTLGNHLLDATESAEIKLNVIRIINHPEYNQRSYLDHDFSLLELETPLDLASVGPHISPVCLPDAANPSQYDDVEAIVSGWGHTSFGGLLSNVLLEASVMTMDNSECDAKHQPFGGIQNSMICSSYPGKGPCQGDSGGPMVTEVDGYYNLIGVVSWVRGGCANPNYPSVYGRVTYVIDWITSTTSPTRRSAPQN